MPRYRFSETVVYKSGSPWPTYEAGRVYDLTVDFGNRWVRRVVAAVDDGADAALPDPRFIPTVADRIMGGEMSANEGRAASGMDAVTPAPVPEENGSVIVETAPELPSEDIVLPRLSRAKR